MKSHMLAFFDENHGIELRSLISQSTIGYSRMSRSESEASPKGARSASWDACAVDPEAWLQKRRVSVTSTLLKDELECLHTSTLNLEQSRSELQHVIERERRAIRDYEREELRRNSNTTNNDLSQNSASARGNGLSFNVRQWLALQMDTVRARREARRDLKRAKRAVDAVEGVAARMEDAMNRDQLNLSLRADALRRQSIDVFCKVNNEETEKHEKNEEDEEEDEEEDIEEDKEEDGEITIRVSELRSKTPDKDNANEEEIGEEDDKATFGARKSDFLLVQRTHYKGFDETLKPIGN